jgi:sulfite reductase (NADPH) flavoprotein alpha-component
VHTGGDLAFLIGVLRALAETGAVDQGFIADHTSGWETARERALAHTPARYASTMREVYQLAAARA